MNGKNFDVFISYRRSDGTDKARILDLAFSIDDCRTFLDFKSLGTGPFDKRLENAVLDAPIFVMVLTPDYFARCNEKGDWVRREIELALDNGKIIIPINYDGKVNCAPDYLDEEFRSRVGCHNFLDLYHGTSFDATIRDIFDKHIRPYVSTHSNNDGKAKVSVIADADCELILDDEIIATVQADKTKQVFVERGEHFFTARSSDYKDIRQEIAKNIDDVSAKYLIKIELADKVQRLKDEEAERIERKKREAELRKAERKAWWKRNEIRFAIASVVITYSVIGLLIYLDWDSTLKTLTGHSDVVRSVAARPDGNYLASGSRDKTIIIWDAKSGEKLKTLKGHSFVVGSVYWSPDGKYLASGSWDKTVIIWDANSGEILQTLEGHSSTVESVSWSPDGNYLASGSRDTKVIIWDAYSGQKLKTLKGHSNGVVSVCWSPDGKYLSSGSTDKTVIIWDAKSGEKFRTLEGHSSYVWSVSFSPDGKYLSSGSTDRTVIIWDAYSGQRLKTLVGHSLSVTSVCWSPDGKYLASCSGDHTIIIWDANSGQILKSLEGHSNTVWSVCWSPDGKYLASGSRDKTIIIWDANSGEKLQTLYGHSNNVESVSWSPDGKYLASDSIDTTVKIWGVE